MPTQTYGADMWPALATLGSGIIGGLSSYFGGQQNAQAAVQAAGINAAEQEKTNQENIQYQTEFAQNGIQWRAADARAAGINPLAALGAQTQSFNNVVAPQPGATNARPGDALTGAGQSVARAIASTQSADDQAYTTASRALSLQHLKLQNDYIESQIRASDARVTHQPGNGPPTPAAAQTYVGGLPSADTVQTGTSFNDRWPLPSERLVQVDPDKVTSGTGTTTAGLHPEVSMGRMASGGVYPEPSHDMSVAMFNPWSQRAWTIRNMVMPYFMDSYRPPEMRGPMWDYNPIGGYTRRSTPRGFWTRPLDALGE